MTSDGIYFANRTPNINQRKPSLQFLCLSPLKGPMKKNVYFLSQLESANVLDFTGHLELKLQVGCLPGLVDNGRTTQTGRALAFPTRLPKKLLTQQCSPGPRGTGKRQHRAQKARRKSVIWANEKLQIQLI